MAALDWLCIVVLLGSLVIGAWRGLVFELLSLASWIVAFFLAQWFAADAAALLPMKDYDPMIQQVTGFVLVFVVAIFACSFLAWLLKKLIDAMGLRPADRALGGIFGLLRGVLVLLVVTVVAQFTPMHEAEWWKISHSAPILEQALAAIKPVLPADMAMRLPV
ncbi:CvpA family protein [Diaphorobacter caeni]|uniref:CvpA family protein n=1 Tax=Diaphorobacter caeni TaxID=2784387 RepID=UPI00188E11FD|nr:CvpA family protein [Diaphorobacter caeni]MBF5006338.1 CvpA family protein [Diaphorobacter caeni]